MSRPVTRDRPYFVCDGVATNGIKTLDWDERFKRVPREWWPVPVFLGGALLAQQVLLSSRYDVGGHAAEHLASASAPFMAAAVVAILLWATPRARRQIDVLAAAAAWFGTTVLVMVGNLRVIDDLVAAGYSHTPTDSVPDVADHALANSSIWYAVVAALVLVASFRWRRQIGNRAAISAAIVTVLFPPWIIPGAGVIVLTIVRCVARRSERTLSGVASHSENRSTHALRQ
ncbi:MAG TPA: hypothetical protein VFV63_15680 [Ilumatobacteraceae bacterium]|nr:hypothetical protein [Ilumatobacteraceae bacterium]